MKAKSINLSADLTEALKAQAPYSKRGRTLAQNAISMLDTTVSNVSYELQSEIDRLYYKNFRNDETTAKLSSQLTKIRSDYSILPQKMREDVDSISRNDFSITVFGRTMAGKSTLMEILTHGDGKSIGNGAQRFTRDVRTYSYKKLNITDVPGVAAFEGKDDEDVAFNAAKKCDLIMFLITDDDVQPEVTECLGRIFALGKPVICIINVKQGIADELNDKEMKFFKSRLSRKLDFERLDGIKKQLYEYGSSYGQDWHLIRFAYVHLKAAFMSQQKKYEAYSEELLELSRFSYVDNLIVSEVTNNGGFYKLKAFTDIVTVPLVESMETLYNQSAENSQQGSILIEKNRVLQSWNKNFEVNAKTEIETFITSVSSDLKRQVAAFAEDNYDNPKADKKWNELIAKQNIAERGQRVLEGLAKQCEGELREIIREVDFDIKFSYFAAEDRTLKMHRLMDGRRIWNWTTSILSGGLLIADLFVAAPLTLIGLGVGGLGFLGNLLFKDYEKKASNARRKLEGKLSNHIEKIIKTLRKRMLDTLQRELLNQYMYPMVDNLNDAVTSLFALSETQYMFAGRLSSKLEDINRTTITEALAYSGFQGLEWHIENIARIPGHAVMIVLGDGKRFPEDAVKALRNILKERIWFVFQKDNLKSVLCQAIGRGVERESIKIQKIKEKPRIAHIPALETVDPDTKVRIRMAQQLTGLLIMK